MMTVMREFQRILICDELGLDYDLIVDDQYHGSVHIDSLLPDIYFNRISDNVNPDANKVAIETMINGLHAMNITLINEAIFPSFGSVETMEKIFRDCGIECLFT